MEPTAVVELGKLIGVGLGAAVGSGVITSVSILSWFQRQSKNGKTPASSSDLKPIQAKVDTISDAVTAILTTNTEQWSLLRQHDRDIARLDERTKNLT